MRKEERKAKWSKQKTPQSERLSAKRNGGGINKHWQNEGRRRQTRQKLSSELREKKNEKIEAAFRLVKVSQSESGHGNVSSGRRRREREIGRQRKATRRRLNQLQLRLASLLLPSFSLDLSAPTSTAAFSLFFSTVSVAADDVVYLLVCNRKLNLTAAF